MKKERIESYIVYSVIESPKGEDRLFPYIFQDKEGLNIFLDKIDEKTRVFLAYKKVSFIPECIMSTFRGEQREKQEKTEVFTNIEIPVEFIDEIYINKEVETTKKLRDLIEIVRQEVNEG